MIVKRLKTGLIFRVNEGDLGNGRFKRAKVLDTFFVFVVTVLSGKVFQRTMVRGKKRKVVIVLCGTDLTEVKRRVPSIGSGA